MEKILVVLLLITGQLFSQNKGIEIYTINSIVNNDPECKYCFDLSKKILSIQPLFESDDIENFDWKEQQFKLTKTGEKKLNELKIPLSGLPVAFVISGEPIYGFWLWKPISSFGCDRVYSYPGYDFKLQFGLPKSNTFGIDPRFDDRIKEYLKVNKK